MSNYFTALNARSVGMNKLYGLPKKKTAPKKPATKPTGMSAEQWAREQAQRYIDARIAAIQQDRDLYLKDLERQSQLELERGLAISQAINALNIPGRVQGIYGNAVADIGGLAQGFSGAVRDSAQAGADQQARMLSGTGQEGAVPQTAAAQGNVVYGVGGYIPARSMAETGAAFASDAALQPAFAAQFGQQAARDVYSEGLQGLDEFTRASNEVRGERFDLEQELLQGRYDQIQDAQKSTLAAQKTAYQRLKDERDWYTKQAYLALAQGDRKRSNQYLGLAKEREHRMQNQDRGLDVNGNVLPGYTVGPDGSIVKIDKTKTKAKTSARAKARKEREDEFLTMEKSLVNDIADLSTEEENPRTGVKTVRKPSYALAFRKLMDKYKYLLRYASAGGQTQLRSRIARLIDQALLEQGIVQSRGAAGHPGK